MGNCRKDYTCQVEQHGASEKIKILSHTGCRTEATKVNSFIAQTDPFTARATCMSHCTALFSHVILTYLNVKTIYFIIASVMWTFLLGLVILISKLLD